MISDVLVILFVTRVLVFWVDDGKSSVLINISRLPIYKSSIFVHVFRHFSISLLVEIVF